VCVGGGERKEKVMDVVGSGCTMHQMTNDCVHICHTAKHQTNRRLWNISLLHNPTSQALKQTSTEQQQSSNPHDGHVDT
jgi:hypothetical protein